MLHTITKVDGTVLAIAKDVLYVKYSKNGSLIQAEDLSEAIGVTYQSTAYNLVGHEGQIAGAETVVITDVDEGTLFYNLIKQMNSSDENQLTIMEGLADLSIAMTSGGAL